jgi:tRNA A37 methylthiotransferase MiaB
MTNPRWTLDMLDPLLDAMSHPKVFKFLHVPAQSGSDAVLEAMRRGNTNAQFESIAAAFHARFPDGALLTDIIVGYPTESDADFDATLAMLDRIAPAAVNRSRFSPRPGTAAARLDSLPGPVIRERMRRIDAVVRRLAAVWHRRRIGRVEPVLTCETRVDGTTVAYNPAHRPVVLQGEWPRGLWVNARIADAAPFHLKGEPIESNSMATGSARRVESTQ